MPAALGPPGTFPCLLHLSQLCVVQSLLVLLLAFLQNINVVESAPLTGDLDSVVCLPYPLYNLIGTLPLHE